MKWRIYKEAVEEVNLKKLLKQNGVTKIPSGMKFSGTKAEWEKHGGHAGKKTIYNMCVQLEHAGWKRGDWSTGGIPDGSAVSNSEKYTSPDGKIVMSYYEYYGATAYDNSYYITFKLVGNLVKEEFLGPCLTYRIEVKDVKFGELLDIKWAGREQGYEFGVEIVPGEYEIRAHDNAANYFPDGNPKVRIEKGVLRGSMYPDIAGSSNKKKKYIQEMLRNFKGGIEITMYPEKGKRAKLPQDGNLTESAHVVTDKWDDYFDVYFVKIKSRQLVKAVDSGYRKTKKDRRYFVEDGEGGGDDGTWNSSPAEKTCKKEHECWIALTT